MDTVLYWLVRTVIAGIQALPLRLVARLGRLGGGLFYLLDARHRKVALANLALCFGQEKSADERRAIARENFQRIGENFASAVKTAVMSPEQMRPHLTFLGAEKIRPYEANAGPQNRVVAIGHFGNFEIYTRFGEYVPVFKRGSTYRGLRQPSLNRLLKSLRERSGCHFYERRSDAAALKADMAGPGLLLGLLADQHAGDRGLRLPFLGHDCSMSTAPAVFALRYRCPLYTSICYRVGLAQWQIEVGDEIPTLQDGQPRSIEDLCRDINRAFEIAVRRDPANWFWVHNRWKAGKWKTTRPQPTTAEVPESEEGE
jgi:lauroyl/myristoyl acyltransferase